MAKKDQTLEALATIRMCIDNDAQALERERLQTTDTGDFLPSEDDDGSDQFAPGVHWTLGAPRKREHISEIERSTFPDFEVQLRHLLSELSPGDFCLGGFVPVKVRYPI